MCRLIYEHLSLRNSVYGEVIRKSPLFFRRKMCHKPKTKTTIDMDCKTAQKVWGHPGGFIKGLEAACPGVLERLGETVNGLVRGSTNPFHQSVKERVGETGRPFYATHAEDDDHVAHMVHDVVGDVAACGLLEQHFSELVGQPIALGNICCKGCNASMGRLTLKELVRIQHAAVRTAPDGSEIVLPIE